MQAYASAEMAPADELRLVGRHPTISVEADAATSNVVVDELLAHLADLVAARVIDRLAPQETSADEWLDTRGARVTSSPDADVLELRSDASATHVQVTVLPPTSPPGVTVVTRCLSGERRVTISIPRRDRRHVARVRAYLNGRRVHAHWTISGRRITLLLPRRAYRLRLVVHLRSHGRTSRIIVRRRYRRC